MRRGIPCSRAIWSVSSPVADDVVEQDPVRVEGSSKAERRVLINRRR